MTQLLHTAIVCCVLCGTIAYGYVSYIEDAKSDIVTEVPVPAGAPLQEDRVPAQRSKPSGLPDLRIRATVSPPQRAAVGETMYIYGDIYNYAPIPTDVASDCDILITNTTTPTQINSTPVRWDGRTYYSLIWDKNKYAAWQWWSRNTTFIPKTPGEYEICTVADRLNVLPESNEKNNYECKYVTVAPNQ